MGNRGDGLSDAVLVAVVVTIIIFVGYAGMDTLVQSSTLEKGDPLYNVTSLFLSSWTDTLFLGFAVCAGVLGPILAYLYGTQNSR